MRRVRGRWYVTREEAAVESDRNLRLQLAIEPARRNGEIRSYAMGINGNPRFWTYRWRIFVLPPSPHSESWAKTCTHAMPLIGHAAFMKRLAWLRENGIDCRIVNSRQRREHDIWDPDLIRGEVLAPPYDEDPDEIADDGHR